MFSWAWGYFYGRSCWYQQSLLWEMARWNHWGRAPNVAAQVISGVVVALKPNIWAAKGWTHEIPKFDSLIPMKSYLNSTYCTYILWEYYIVYIYIIVYYSIYIILYMSTYYIDIHTYRPARRPATSNGIHWYHPHPSLRGTWLQATPCSIHTARRHQPWPSSVGERGGTGLYHVYTMKLYHVMSIFVSDTLW